MRLFTCSMENTTMPGAIAEGFRVGMPQLSAFLPGDFPCCWGQDPHYRCSSCLGIPPTPESRLNYSILNNTQQESTLWQKS